MNASSPYTTPSQAPTGHFGDEHRSPRIDTPSRTGRVTGAFRDVVYAVPARQAVNY